MKKGKTLIVLGLLLIAAALGLIIYNFWDAHRAGKASEAVLSQLAPQVAQAVEGAPVYPASGSSFLPESGENAVEYPDFVLNPEMAPPTQEIDGNFYIGILSLPSLRRTLPIVAACSDENLKIAPCCYNGSPYLENFVIAGHNYFTHFSSLGAMRIGDSVTFTDLDGNVFAYEVAEVTTLPANAVEEMTAGDWALTLFTCTAGRTERITVRCKPK